MKIWKFTEFQQSSFNSLCVSLYVLALYYSFYCLVFKKDVTWICFCFVLQTVTEEIYPLFLKFFQYLEEWKSKRKQTPREPHPAEPVDEFIPVLEKRIAVRQSKLH